MQTLKNKVTLIGHVGQKPTVFNFQNGGKKASFSIATNESYKNKEGEWVTNTQWHEVEATGPVADRVLSTIDKGLHMVVDGRLVNQSFTTKTGEKRVKTVINAREFVVLTAKNQN